MTGVGRMGWFSRMWSAVDKEDRREDAPMKLVVGLGNPGRRYERTRHNVGFWVLDQLGQDSGSVNWSSRFSGLVHEIRWGDERIVLLKPTTFMNASGRSVRQAVDFYKLDLARLLVVCDDFALNRGRLRIRGSGSAGGQNGLKDVIRVLGTDVFARLRIGIGPPRGDDVVDYVLTEFRDDERTLIEDSIVEAAKAVQAWSRDGVAAAMNAFNGIDLSKE